MNLLTRTLGPYLKDDVRHMPTLEEQAQLRILRHRGRQEPGTGLGLRRLHIGLLDRRGGCQLGWVVADPAPYHVCLRAPDRTAWTSWTVLAVSGRPSLPPRVRSWV